MFWVPANVIHILEEVFFFLRKTKLPINQCTLPYLFKSNILTKNSYSSLFDKHLNILLRKACDLFHRVLPDRKMVTKGGKKRALSPAKEGEAATIEEVPLTRLVKDLLKK